MITLSECVIMKQIESKTDVPQTRHASAGASAVLLRIDLIRRHCHASLYINFLDGLLIGEPNAADFLLFAVMPLSTSSLTPS
jgi:hypothetical protein